MVAEIVQELPVARKTFEIIINVSGKNMQE
jgi:hypothetical protein